MYCVAPLKQKKSKSNESSEIIKFGEVLERIYPLLQIIFNKLSYEDLKSASQVNSIWGKYGIEEMQRRTKASWVSLSKPQPPEIKVETSSNFKYDGMTFGFIFYNYHLIRLNKYICIHENPTITMTLAEYLTNVIMAKDTDFWAFSCSTIYSPIVNRDYECSFTGVFVPEIPNIKMEQFIISCDDTDIFENTISKNEHIHCILLFTLAHPNAIIRKFTKELSNRKNVEKIAFGGGVISNGIKPFQKNIRKVYKSNTLFFITFTQEISVSADFDAYSVVIPDNNNFEEDLIRFKERICLRKHSFALRICCSAKHGKLEETTIFKKVFPDIFMVGLDADGEIGWNKFDCWKPEEDAPQAKKQKIHHHLCHQYTTIIVILTWGKKIQNSNE